MPATVAHPSHILAEKTDAHTYDRGGGRAHLADRSLARVSPARIRGSSRVDRVAALGGVADADQGGRGSRCRSACDAAWARKSAAPAYDLVQAGAVKRLPADRSPPKHAGDAGGTDQHVL